MGIGSPLLAPAIAGLLRKPQRDDRLRGAVLPHRLSRNPEGGTHPNARDYLAKLAAASCYHLRSAEACTALGVSAAAAKLALNRLSKQGLVASPARGFYAIVPPEYSSLRSLPADQFVPALMQHLGLSYYAGLLSAAQYHGAAHHRPQEFQVMQAKPGRTIASGAWVVLLPQ